MSCPFAASGLRQVQQLEAEMNAREQATGDKRKAADSDNQSGKKQKANGNESHSAAAAAAASSAPTSVFTGGPRTSYGVENAHPLRVWMRGMQARGALEGIDIEKELQGLAGSAADETEAQKLLRQQQDKTWKEKRDHPPMENNGNGATCPAGATASKTGSSISTCLESLPPGAPLPLPAPLSTYPGLFASRMDHNAHGPNVLSKYDQEITYWNYVHP